MLKSNKIILKNTVAQYLKVILSTIISLFATRIVLRQLGVADYGIFSVIAGFVTLFGVMNNSMIVAVQRFVSYEIPTKDYKKISSIYSTSLYIHCGIALLILILCETIGLYFLKHKMLFPAGRLEDAIFVYHCVVATLIFNVLSIPQQALLISFEKIYISSLIGILDTVLKFGGAVILIYLDTDKLKAYALIYAFVSVTIRLLYTYSVRHFITDIRFNNSFNYGLLKELFSFASWNLLGAVSNILKLQGVNVVLNMFYGTIINTAYGLANQVSSNLNVLSSSIFQSSNSQVIQSYRRNDMQRMNSLVISMTKIAFSLFFIISLPVICLSDQLFMLWLGEIPEGVTILLRLMLINAAIELFSVPLMYIMQATGNIKHYFIVVSLTMLLILPISYILLKIGFPYYTVLLVTMVINIFLLIIRIAFVAINANFSVKLYVKEVILSSFLIITFMMGIMWTITEFLHFNVWWVVGPISIFLVVISVWFILLNQEEKRMSRDFIYNIFRKVGIVI